MECLSLQDIDVVLSDIVMPNMSGLIFHERARSIPQYEHIPWIFLTGHKSLAKYDRTIRSDYDMILEKPFPIDRLLKLFSGQYRTS